MRVYVVIKEYVGADGADTGSDMKVYSTYQLAKEYFDTEVKWLKRHDPIIVSGIEYDEELGEMHYSLWKSHHYNENHICLSISEEVVEE